MHVYACPCCARPWQVLSPATILAIDLAAVTLLDVPCLAAFILGVLADEFGWVAKSFPQAFSVSASGEGVLLQYSTGVAAAVAVASQIVLCQHSHCIMALLVKDRHSTSQLLCLFVLCCIVSFCSWC
jgi:hypothetical protein